MDMPRFIHTKQQLVIINNWIQLWTQMSSRWSTYLRWDVGSCKSSQLFGPLHNVSKLYKIQKVKTIVFNTISALVRETLLGDKNLALNSRNPRQFKICRTKVENQDDDVRGDNEQIDSTKGIWRELGIHIDSGRAIPWSTRRRYRVIVVVNAVITSC